MRYPGRLLAPGEVIPEPITRYLAAQLGIRPEDLIDYAVREETRHEHLAILRNTYGYKMFTGQGARDLKAWLTAEAELARSNVDMARRFVEQCRTSQTILPGVTVIERLCADVLVSAERQIEARIVRRLNDEACTQLDALLSEEVEGHVTRFVWLRQFEVGQNSADVNRLLDRLEFLQNLELAGDALAGVPPHRIAQLRRQGERYFAGDLRDISGDRRLAILAVCALEWQSAIADAIVESHDRIVGKTWRDAKKLCAAQIADAKSALHETLCSFKNLGAALLEAKGDDESLDAATESSCGWPQLETLVATAAGLTDTLSADPMAHVVHGYHRFRRYAPRMLRALDIRAASVADPLLAAAIIIADPRKSPNRPMAFLRAAPKWHRHLKNAGSDEPRLWEVAVMSHLREAFRSGDIWLASSRRYGDLKGALVPVEFAQTVPKLAMPLEPETWIEDRKARLEEGLQRLAKAARTGSIPGGTIENGVLITDRLASAVPA